MTTYHFKRSANRPLMNAGLLNYLPFLVLSILALVLNTINIPIFFGGEYHIFLFEAVLFYLIFVKHYKKYLITIFILYAVLDIMEEIVVGISFLSFFASLTLMQGLIIFTNIKLKTNSLLLQTALLFLFVLIFTIFKISLMYIFNEFTISSGMILFLLKSTFYSCFLFFNLQLLVNSNKILKI